MISPLMAAWIAEGRRRRLAIRDHSERVGRLPPLQSGEAERLVTSYFARRALAHRPPAAPVAAGDAHQHDAASR